jgi:hypothetical protein
LNFGHSQVPIYQTLDYKNYTIMVVDEHGIQTFEVVLVVLLLLLLLFDVLSCNIFKQAVCPNILKCHYGSEIFSDILS